jgi:hypothetical protein
METGPSARRDASTVRNRSSTGPRAPDLAERGQPGRETRDGRVRGGGRLGERLDGLLRRLFLLAFLLALGRLRRRGAAA